MSFSDAHLSEIVATLLRIAAHLEGIQALLQESRERDIEREQRRKRELAARSMIAGNQSTAHDD